MVMSSYISCVCNAVDAETVWKEEECKLGKLGEQAVMSNCAAVKTHLLTPHPSIRSFTHS